MCASAAVLMVPPPGLEPGPSAPEADTLSAELRGPAGSMVRNPLVWGTLGLLLEIDRDLRDVHAGTVLRGVFENDHRAEYSRRGVFVGFIGVSGSFATAPR